MLRQVLAVVAVAMLVGCAGGGGNRGSASTRNTTATIDPPAEAMSDTQLAAHAGDAEFPTAQATDGPRVAAVVSADRRTIKLYNFDNDAVRAVNVWINGSYVQPLRAIPANSKAHIQADKLFNKIGQRFSQRGEEVTRVQIETQDGLFKVMGPATE
jgi:nucleoid-associated protein YgaU